ncbi:hypothetical protein [Effusibacillus consociatus]|uniref:Uncharacterized protein n=1 Tax=Effusibacillus consociatus TaxID=1117041 RepID=A0ABV9PZU9_9BACL
MEEIKQGLRDIAIEMRQALGDDYTEDEYYELVSSTYKSMQSHYGEKMDVLDPETVVRVLRRQMGELIRMGRAKKLLEKRGHVAPKEK